VKKIRAASDADGGASRGALTDNRGGKPNPAAGSCHYEEQDVVREEETRGVKGVFSQS